MGQARDFFKKIGDTKETFHAKDENGKDLTEAEDIKKRWQTYTEWERLGISSRKSEIPKEHFMQR